MVIILTYCVDSAPTKLTNLIGWWDRRSFSTNLVWVKFKLWGRIANCKKNTKLKSSTHHRICHWNQRNSVLKNRIRLLCWNRNGRNVIDFLTMDDNELISVCNNLKQLQKVMIEINDVVEGMTDTNLKEKMSYLESAQMHLVMAEISINMFYGLFLWY